MPNSIPFQNTLTIIHLRTFDKKIVLQSLFSRHSRMCMLLGVLEWQIFLCSRMLLKSGFKNAAPKSVKKDGSRISKCWCFRNDLCSVQALCLTFWNAKILVIPEEVNGKGSRMCWNLVFWNLWFLGIPEWLKNAICRTFFVLKCPFFCHSGMAN